MSGTASTACARPSRAGTHSAEPTTIAQGCGAVHVFVCVCGSETESRRAERERGGGEYDARRLERGDSRGAMEFDQQSVRSNERARSPRVQYEWAAFVQQASGRRRKQGGANTANQQSIDFNVRARAHVRGGAVLVR